MITHMKKILLPFALLLICTIVFAQKKPKLTYSENFANENLRSKELVIKGKLIATDEQGGLLFFLEKTKDKFILTRVYNSGSFFDKDAPKYVKDVIYYHLSPELLKKLTIKPIEDQKGYYQIDSQLSNIPYEQDTENKVKRLRWGFGEKDGDGYELVGAQTIQIGIFSSNKIFENFKKELFK